MRTVPLIRALTLGLVTALALAAPARADGGKHHTPCPKAITDAVTAHFADATIKKCHAEREDGHDQFEAKLVTKDGHKLEVDVGTDGAILQTEEKIDVAAVPAAVQQAFAKKYPKAKLERAEQQTHADNSASYEVAFHLGAKRHEATFKSDGTFVEEE